MYRQPNDNNLDGPEGYIHYDYYHRGGDIDDSLVVTFEIPIWSTFVNVVGSIGWCILVYWAVRGYFLGLYEYGWMWMLAAIPVLGIPALYTYSYATACKWMMWKMHKRINVARKVGR
jgi:energy-converting hydrogenase Eha subunit H